MKSVVILGSSGFIGKHLYKNFNKKYITYSFCSKECNLLDYKDLKNKLSKINHIDTIIMCSSITRLTDNSIESMNKNIQMAKNLALFISKNPIKQLIFLSSIDVYGNNVNGIYNEKTPLLPEDYYSTSKVTSEFIFLRVCKEYNINLFIPRLSGVFGNNDKKKSTLYHLVSSAINKKSIKLYNNGEDTRDFIYIDYLFEIINNAIKIDFNGILNIATGKSYTIEEISKIIKDILKYNIELEYVGNSSNERLSKIEFDISNLKNSNLIESETLDLYKYIEEYIRKFNDK